jgi:hypothetical protein
MESNTIKLREETTKKINHIDNSIMFWSLQLGQIMMKMREIESQIGSLYDFKKSAVLEDLKAQDIDIKDCDVSTLDSSTVIIKKSPPTGEPGELKTPGE